MLNGAKSYAGDDPLGDRVTSSVVMLKKLCEGEIPMVPICQNKRNRGISFEGKVGSRLMRGSSQFCGLMPFSTGLACSMHLSA